MALNMDSILQTIQDMRSQLEIWGINTEALLVLGAVASVLFILSLREVTNWYLRVNQMRDEVQALRLQIQSMDATLKEIALNLRAPEMTEDTRTPLLGKEDLLKIAEGMRKESPAPRFNFDH